MFLINNLDINIVSWVVLGGSSVYIAGSIIKNLRFTELLFISSEDRDQCYNKIIIKLIYFNKKNFFLSILL
jgi:hypothetical protein